VMVKREMTKEEIQRELVRAGVEENPGPRSKRVKIARRARSRSRSVSTSRTRSRSGSRTRFAKTKRRVRSRSAPRKSYLSQLGSLVGGSLAGPPGAKFGGSAGSFLSHITGMGDYKIEGNSFLGKGIVGGSSAINAVPTFTQGSDGMDVCHSEFLGDVIASNLFSVTEYIVQPGLSTTFPWLWNIAANFQEYFMLGMVFHYKPSSGMVTGTSPALGMIILATEYNVNAPSFTTKVQMETSQFCTSVVPFEPMTHPIECKRGANLLETLLVRGPVLPAGGTAQNYDMCRVSIAAQGMPSAAGAYTCGELWVSYHVRLKKPIQLAVVQPTSYAHLMSRSLHSATAAAPLGLSGGVLSSTSNPLIATRDDVSPTTTFIMPTPGFYKIDVTYYTTNANGATPPTLTLGTNVIVISSCYAGSLDHFTSEAISAYNGMISQFVIVVAPASSARLNTVVLGGMINMTAADVDIYVTPYPYNFD
jgi:hypothetical protein